MKEYQLRLELLSPTLVGSGLGFGAHIDADVVSDEFGMPFVPARRIKGCLRDAAEEALGMFCLAGIRQDGFETKLTFGVPGSATAAPVHFSNLYLEDYRSSRTWLTYLMESEGYGDIVTPERVLSALTEIRQQTQVGKKGIAADHTLRTIRVLRKGIVFYGDVRAEVEDKQILNTLLLACLNFRKFGTKRNRGFGAIRCSLLYEGGEMDINGRLEALCTA